MKKIYLFISLLTVYGCESNTFFNSEIKDIPCPKIFFAENHNIYIGTSDNEINIDNITYKAEMNNVIFSDGCKSISNKFLSNLSFLFVATPILQNEQNINLPFYVLIADQNNKSLNIDYYFTIGSFKKNFETDQSIETELIETIELSNEYLDKDIKIIVGFILDEKRKNILY